MKVDSAPVTLPDEGPEQRWRRTVRKRPAKLKLGRLLRDFGYAELDDDVADAIEARMATVGLAIRPPLREAAADEIVTVYRAPEVSDPEVQAPAEAEAEATARPPKPATPAAPARPRPKPRRAADPDSARKITDLKGQLADARAESERLRTELDSRVSAMADADRVAREHLAEQTAVVDDQAHRLAELSGLLNETRAALAEARDEIRRAVGVLPAAVVEAPVEDGGLSEEEGWLTDADEPLPPSPEEAAVSAIAMPVDEPDEFAADAEEPETAAADAVVAPSQEAPAADLDALPMDDVFARPLDSPPDDDGFASAVGGPPAEQIAAAEEDVPLADDDLVIEPVTPSAQEEPLAPDADPPPGDDVFTLEPKVPAEADVPADAAAAAEEGVSGVEAEAEVPEEGDVFSPPAGAAPDDDVFSPPAEPGPEDDDVFSPPAEPGPEDDDVFSPPAEPAPENDVFSPSAEAAPEDDVFTFAPEPEPAPTAEWRLDDDDEPARPPVGELDVEPADGQVGEILAAADGPPGTPPDGSGEPAPSPAPTTRPEDGPAALPPPPPLPPSPFADELPARPPEPSEKPAKPAKRGRMARGRGRWQGTCSVCERFPEVTRRKDLEAAGWELDGDFPKCPQCRGLG